MNNQEVIITDAFKYADGFKGLRGIIVREFESGCNIYLSDINGGGDYNSHIYYFPYGTFENVSSK